LGGLAFVGVIAVGVLLLSGCGQAGNQAAPKPEGGAATQATAPGVPEQSTPVVVGTSMPSSGNVMGDPLVARDDSGSPIPQTPTVPVPSKLVPDASGVARVTLDNHSYGSRIEMKVGDSIDLVLGDAYEWEIDVQNPTILSVQPPSAESGSQGVYKAVKAGRTMLEASGEPFCRKSNPPCGMPSRGISLEVVVK
jgi:uncharacterized protein YceK